MLHIMILNPGNRGLCRFRGVSQILCLVAFAIFLHKSAFVQSPQEANRLSDHAVTLVQTVNNGLEHQQSTQNHGNSLQHLQVAFVNELPQDEPSSFATHSALVLIPPSLNSLLLYTQTTSTLL
jgi:hypothetical protein